MPVGIDLQEALEEQSNRARNSCGPSDCAGITKDDENVLEISGEIAEQMELQIK